MYGYVRQVDNNCKHLTGHLRLLQYCSIPTYVICWSPAHSLIPSLILDQAKSILCWLFSEQHFKPMRSLYRSNNTWKLYYSNTHYKPMQTQVSTKIMLAFLHCPILCTDLHPLSCSLHSCPYCNKTIVASYIHQ